MRFPHPAGDRGGPWQAEVRRQQTYVRGLRLFLADARARLLEQSCGADRAGGREVAGLAHVQAERADHQQNSRGDDCEVDAIHALQPSALAIVATSLAPLIYKFGNGDQVMTRDADCDHGRDRPN